MSNESFTARMLSLIDLTNLDETATAKTIETFAKKAMTPHGTVAGICVYPQFVKQVSQLLANTKVKTVTVANFPQGEDSISEIENSISASIQNGAEEIDLVFPYKKYLSNQKDEALAVVQAARNACKDKILKIILETGYFSNSEKIIDACNDIIPLKIDFIKTSTGKIAIGTTLEAAKAILKAIKNNNHHCDVGLKISGGVKTIEAANSYIQLVKEIMGEEWLNSSHFRIGASQLVDEIIKYP